jgi:Xaa-Pro aminopeptidase
MFQTFDAPAASSHASARLAALRSALADLKLDAFLVPRTDAHQGEFVPASGERLKWLSGFSGSAGEGAVARRAAALFVDSRYTVQVKAEADGALFAFESFAPAAFAGWLAANVKRGGIVGYDPWCHTVADIERLAALLGPHGLALKPVARNPIDALWGEERPARPHSPIEAQPIVNAGRSSADKIADVQAALKKDGQDAVVVTLPDSVAWLFNIRGRDIAHTPVVLAFALVPVSGKPELFADAKRLTPEAAAALKGLVRLSPPNALKSRLAALRKAKKRVRLDPATAAAALGRDLGGPAKGVRPGFVRGADPCVALKAAKNAAEIAGARAAHVRDGAAMVRFLAWLDRGGASGKLDEIAVVRRLEAFRRESNALLDISFPTICGAGPNGAIVHYRVNEATNRRIKAGDILLVDSGGQYRDGTTDITRTIAIGEAKPEPRQRFTLVLKGMIAISTARFPKGTRGIDLDPFARAALWRAGLDYGHGTGHGIGSYLAVHEGPQSISRGGMAELKPGMLVSNEPGYYKEGGYGIRIENVILVTEPEAVKGGDKPLMGFETLTLAPVDRRLVDPALMTADEMFWLDAYHARVLAEIGHYVDADTRDWLETATAPICAPA